MKIHSHENNITWSNSDNHKGGVLIDSSHGAENGFCMGISIYHSNEYGHAGIHDDQEGFYVIEGTGTAKIGTEEIPLSPGCSFIVSAGTPHTLKKDPSCKELKVLWSHGAV